MDKRGASEIVTIVLLVFLALVAVLLILDIINSVVEKETEKIELEDFTESMDSEAAGVSAGDLETAQADCLSDWECEEWSKCQVIYNLDAIISDDIFLEGEMQRKCKDLNKCNYNKIEQKECETKANVSVERVNRCSKEYIEVRDKDEVLISRLELTNGTSQELNIQLFLGDVKYCSYCYNDIKDYDEDEVDCVYQGDSCPIC